MTVQEARSLYKEAVEFDRTGINPEGSPLRKMCEYVYKSQPQ